MTLMVTGALGYIGTQFALADITNNGLLLVDNGEERYPHQLELLQDQFNFEKADVGDFATVQKLIEDYEVTDVLHLAAFTDAAESMMHPSKYRQGNTEVTKSLIHACRDRVNSFTFASSAAVYGEREGAVSEFDDPKPANPYGMSKLRTEDHLDRFLKKSNTGYMALRFFNVIGSNKDLCAGKTDGTDLLSRALHAAFTQEPMNLYGDGYAFRDFISIHNVVEAIGHGIKMAKAKTNEIMNVGTGRPTHVKDMIELVETTLNLEVPVNYRPKRPGDVQGFVADMSHAKSLGWTPRPQKLDQDILTAHLWDRLYRAGCYHIEPLGEEFYPT